MKIVIKNILVFMVLEDFVQKTVNSLGVQSMLNMLNMLYVLIKNVKTVDLHMEHGNVNIVMTILFLKHDES